MATPPVQLVDVSLCDKDGTMVVLTALAESSTRLYMHGTTAGAGPAVRSDAVVRWYVDYDGEGPVVVVQSLSARYALLAKDSTASGRYAALWSPVVRSVTLTAAVLAAARDRVHDVWAVAAPHLSVDEQLLEWPFVREQLRALRVLRAVRRPAPAAAAKAPAAAGVEAPLDSCRPLSRKRRLGTPATASSSSVPEGSADDEAALVPTLSPGEAMEVQQMRCRTPRYGVVQRCRSCSTNRNEQCRFRYMRRLATRDGLVIRPLGTFEDGSGYRLNIARHGLAGSGSAVDHARYVLEQLAVPFVDVVTEELRMSEGEEVVIVNAKARGAPPKQGVLPQGYSKDGGERQLCDWCSTTLFNRSAPGLGLGLGSGLGRGLVLGLRVRDSDWCSTTLFNRSE